METLWKWARRLLVGLAALEVAYVVAGNAVLNLPFGQGFLSRSPDALTIAWSGGYTVVPGRVTLWGLEVVTPVVAVKADRVSAGLFFPALLSREIRVTGVSVDALDVALISRPPKKPHPAVSPWSLSIPSIEVQDIERVSAGTLAVQGSGGTLRGSVHLQLGGALEVSDVALAWSGATLLDGTTSILSPLTLTVQADLGPFSPGQDALDSLSAHAKVSGRARTLAHLLRVLGPRTGIERLDGTGSVVADIGFAAGRFTEGGALDVDADALSLSTLGYDVAGSGKVEVRTTTGLVVNLTFADYVVRREGDPWIQVEGRNLALSGTTTGLAARDLGQVEVAIVVPDAKMPDIQALGAYLPQGTGMQFTRGSATVHATLEASSARPPKGSLVLRGEGLDGTLGGSELRTDLRLEVAISGGDLEERALDLKDSRVVLDQTTLTGAGGKKWPWGAVVTLGEAQAVFHSPIALKSTVLVEMADSSGLLVLLEDEVKIFELLKDVDFRDVVAEAAVQVQDRALSVRGLGLHTPTLRGAAELALSKGDDRVLFWLKAHGVGVAYLAQPGHDANELEVLGAQKWFDRQRTVFWTPEPAR